MSEKIERILVVDDDKSTAKLIMDFLGDLERYEVFGFFSPKEALKFFSKKRDEIGLVISDVLMPGMSGVEMVKEMREIREDVRVIFITGNLEREDPFQVEHDGILWKPFSFKDLEEIISRIS